MNTSNVPIKLSQAKPDFEAIVLQAQQYLSQKSTWIDMLTSSTGQTLIELMAAIGTFNQHAIESGAREGFLDTAKRDSSIYAITRMLGVRITRKVPAGVDVTLTRDAVSFGTVIPRFTQFTVGSNLFFNRTAIVFQQGASSASCTLYEGTINTKSFPAIGTAFQEVYLNVLGFSVSDLDLDVFVIDPSTNASTKWDMLSDGIWIANQGDLAYYDNTSGLGDTILSFGDNYHGAVPQFGFNIQVVYATTSGSQANAGMSGINVTSTDGLLKGVTTSVISGGADEKPALYYQAVAPNLYKARKRAVTSSDYKALTLYYPAVASCVIQAQRDIAPNDLRWMTVVEVTILPTDTDTFSDRQWNDYKDWLSTKQHVATYVKRNQPIKVTVNIELVLALIPNVDATFVVADATQRITALFAKGIKTLGGRIAISDITDASKNTGLVDYVDMVSPNSDLVCETKYHYFALGDLVVNVKYSERTF